MEILSELSMTATTCVIFQELSNVSSVYKTAYETVPGVGQIIQYDFRDYAYGSLKFSA